MRTAVVITGASRGFGRFLALEFARQLAPHDLQLHLWARNELELQETARLARDAHKNANGESGALHTFTQSVDLRDSDDYVAKAELLLSGLTAASLDKVFLVHNAGALGALGFAQECSSPEELRRHWELNVTSVLWLDKRFLDVFGASRKELLSPSPEEPETTLVLLNVSSRAALAPYKTMGLYCTAKAAREMHFRVVAAEQAAGRKTRVLSYSPGAMDTAMQHSMRESPGMLPQLAARFADMKDKGALVSAEQSSRRGVDLAVRGDFESGAHVTFGELQHFDTEARHGSRELNHGDDSERRKDTFQQQI